MQNYQKRKSIQSLNVLKKTPSLSEIKISHDKNQIQNGEILLSNLSEAVGLLKLSFESNMTLGMKLLLLALYCHKFLVCFLILL